MNFWNESPSFNQILKENSKAVFSKTRLKLKKLDPYHTWVARQVWSHNYKVNICFTRDLQKNINTL